MFATHVPILGWVYCALLLLPTGPDRAAMRRGLSASTRAARNPGTALLDCRTCCVTKHKHQLPANAHVRCLGLVSVARSNFCRVCPCGDEHCACTRQRCRRTSPGRRCSLVDQTQRPPQGWSIFDQPISIAHTCPRGERTQRHGGARAPFSTMMRGPCLWPNGSPTSTLQRPAA